MSSPGAIRTRFGYAAHSLPLVETVSPSIRQNIITGRDINLAALLIPYFNGNAEMQQPTTTQPTCINDHSTRQDVRLLRSLNLGEFIQAFAVYKHIMCSVFAHRHIELDIYERDIVDMASRYPGKGFYDYHRQFSLQASSQLRYNNVPVDWSIRDNNLFCNIFANVLPNSCELCQSTLHSSGFCPSINQSAGQSGSNLQNKGFSYGQRVNRSTQQPRLDNAGRPRRLHDGREVCNNYNSPRGCQFYNCNNLHVCSDCKAGHSRVVCPLYHTQPPHKRR